MGPGTNGYPQRDYSGEPASWTSSAVLGHVPGVVVVRIECWKPAGEWTPLASLTDYGLMLPRRGGFSLRRRGRLTYVDETTGFFELPTVEQQIGHQVDGDHDCTYLMLSERAMVDYVGDAVVPDSILPTSPRLDLRHRALIRRLAQGIDGFETEERLAAILGEFANVAAPGRLLSRRRQTEAAHLFIVDRVRQAIAEDPVTTCLGSIADDLGYSRFHVSRVFNRMTGTSISRHRNHVRVTRALDRLDEGERNLALLAAELGFVDQSHMIRVIRAATGERPSDLRRWLPQPTPSFARA